MRPSLDRLPLGRGFYCSMRGSTKKRSTAPRRPPDEELMKGFRIA